MAIHPLFFYSYLWRVSLILISMPYILSRHGPADLTRIQTGSCSIVIALVPLIPLIPLEIWISQTKFPLSHRPWRVKHFWFPFYLDLGTRTVFYTIVTGIRTSLFTSLYLSLHFFFSVFFLVLFYYRLLNYWVDIVLLLFPDAWLDLCNL